MAIQFRCPGCSQPIEVDDVYAGQTAACPYCHRVVNVPAESSLETPPATPARPAGGVPSPPPALGQTEFQPAPPPPPPMVEASESEAAAHRAQAARTYGNYGLVCTALALAIMLATMVYGAALLMKQYDPSATSQPPIEQLSQNLALKHPALAAGPLGAMFFAVVGLALGITSVRQIRHGNWRGVTSTVVCGLFVLCFCGINALTLLGGGLVGPP